jgi:parvulin-like peptidyl-prolyl isomerase
MMQTLRKKTRLVLFIALAGFAGLIFFQWGLDITGIRNRPETDIAKIGNQTVTYQDYRRFAMLKESENKNVTPDEIWRMLVDEIVWRELVRKERIGINDEEIWQIIRNNPPPEIYESEFMQDENGEFDWNKYYQLIQSPQSLQWLYQYEMQLRQNLPKEKLRSLISTMAWVSPFEDSIALSGMSNRYDISFLSLQINNMRGLVQVTDEEVEDYYRANQDEFAVPEYKILKYVFFERKPSSYDTLEARQRLEDFLAMVEEGENFTELAREVSDDTTIDYRFENENIMKPYMRTVYEELKNGEVSGIVQGARGFEVMKKVGRGSMQIVKANVQVSRTTIGEITDNIASFMETAEDIGFDSAAGDFGLNVLQTYPLDPEELNFPVRNLDGLADFLRDVKEGELSSPFSSLGGYYVFAFDSVIPGSKPSLEEASPRVRATVARQAYEKVMVEYLNNLHTQITSGVAMEAVAQRDTIVQFHGDISGQVLFELRGTYGDKFVGALASLAQGEISAPVTEQYVGYIIRCDRKEEVPFDSTLAGMLQWKRQMILQQVSQELFTPEEIVDYRDQFFE